MVVEAAAHGLAPITGSAGTVGVVGYLLGGGLGPLARSHGFSSDYVESFTVITGTGEIVEASSQQNPDLFWALRGGKFGLGIVTEVRLRLVPLVRLYAGALFFAEAETEAALRGWIRWTAQADRRITSSAALIRFPSFEAVPAPLRGRRLLSVRFALPDPGAAGPQLAAPLRALAPVHLDALGDLAAADIARIHNDPTEPGPSWVAGQLLGPIDDDFASALLAEVGPESHTPFIAAEIRQIGGATAPDVPGGSAVGGRAASYTLGLVGVDPAGFADAMPAAADRAITRLQRYLSPETNANFLANPRSTDRLTVPWLPETAARLQTIRRRFDPEGLWHNPSLG